MEATPRTTKSPQAMPERRQRCQVRPARPRKTASAHIGRLPSMNSAHFTEHPSALPLPSSQSSKSASEDAVSDDFTRFASKTGNDGGRSISRWRFEVLHKPRAAERTVAVTRFLWLLVAMLALPLAEARATGFRKI